MHITLRVSLALALLAGPIQLPAQKPDDDAMLRRSLDGTVSETVAHVVAAFAEQQVPVSGLYEGARAATVVAVFPHDPATEVMIRVSVWTEGDSVVTVIGGTYRLMRADYLHIPRSTRGREGQLWARIERLAAELCRRAPCRGG
jgi:hypothetical protein